MYDVLVGRSVCIIMGICMLSLEDMYLVIVGICSPYFLCFGIPGRTQSDLIKPVPKVKNRQAKMANKIGVKIKKFKLKYNTSFGRSAS